MVTAAAWVSRGVGFESLGCGDAGEKGCGVGSVVVFVFVSEIGPGFSPDIQDLQ